MGEGVFLRGQGAGLIDRDMRQASQTAVLCPVFAMS